MGADEARNGSAGGGIQGVRSHGLKTERTDDIAERINTRPRRVLDWATAAELLLPRVREEYVA